MGTNAAALLSALLLVGLGHGAAAQDPQALLNGMIRREAVEAEQRYQDRQRARAETEAERAYDARLCAEVGYSPATPEYYQCIRDSAAYRRSAGQAGESARRPRLECTSVGDDGIVDTVCD